MSKIGRKRIGISEIAIKLKEKQIFKEYLNKIRVPLSYDLIKDSLLQQSFAAEIEKDYYNESFIILVPFKDFKERSFRIIE
ncbi:MAG: hypothetical protein ACFFCD_14795 [Promethearchaeota archaeon]